MSTPVRPLPPPDFDARPVSTWRIPKGSALHRFYPTGLEPEFYDTGRSGRLNAPDGTFGVLYVAWTPRGAFAETFLREPGRTLLPPDLVAGRSYVVFEALRPLRIVRIYGRWMAPLGATAEVTASGPAYDVPQAWSAALYAHPSKADGIAYYARHDNSELCVALFDRARGALAEVRREPDLDQEWFWELAERYGVGAAPTGRV